MSVKTRTQLLADAAVIRDETVTNANTCLRVGGHLIDIIDSIFLASEYDLQATAVSTSNIASLSGTGQTVDGKALNEAGVHTCLCTAQTSADENGLWLVQSGPWTRPANFATGSDAGGVRVYIQEGTDHHDTVWACTTDDPDAVVDTDNLAWKLMPAGVGTAYGIAHATGHGLDTADNLRVIDDSGTVRGIEAASGHLWLKGDDGAKVYDGSVLVATLTSDAAATVKVHDPADENVYVAIADDRVVHFTDNDLYYGFGQPHSSGAGKALDVHGQDAKSGSTQAGGKIRYYTGAGDGSGADGAYEVYLGSSLIFNIAPDASAYYVGIQSGTGTLPGTGTLRLGQEGSIKSRTNTPADCTMLSTYEDDCLVGDPSAHDITKIRAATSVNIYKGATLVGKFGSDGGGDYLGLGSGTLPADGLLRFPQFFDIIAKNTSGADTDILKGLGTDDLAMGDGTNVADFFFYAHDKFHFQIQSSTRLRLDATGVGMYGATPAAQASDPGDLTDNIGGTVNTTLDAIPDPADSPATADALRDDLVANALPEIRDALSTLASHVDAVTLMLSAGRGGIGVCA